MKRIAGIIALILIGMVGKAQTTGMDFNRMDCNGNMRHLFTDLDSGKVVILEFFMGPACNSCMDAAKEVEGMKTKLLAKYPGKVMTYAMGYQNSYSCSLITNWVSSQGISAIPMDSGATQVAYYGGFSMPTIVALAGSSHSIIYTANPNNGGYTNGDTSKMKSSINNFFDPTGIQSVLPSIGTVSLYPNPANETVTVSLDVTAAADIQVQIVNFTGQVVARMPGETVNPGVIRKTVDVTGLSAGTYMVLTGVNGITVSRAITIVK